MLGEFKTQFPFKAVDDSNDNIIENRVSSKSFKMGRSCPLLTAAAVMPKRVHQVVPAQKDQAFPPTDRLSCR